MVSDTEQAAGLYISTFSGRSDAYSIWSGEQWVATRKPLTPEVVIKAFTTKVPVSAYVLSPDSTTHLAMLDIDREYGMALGRKVAATLNGLGGIGYLEASRRGCHFWILMDATRPAVLIRRALRGLIAEAKLPPCPGSGEYPIAHPTTHRPVCPGCSASQQHEDEQIDRHDDPKIELRPGSDHLNGPDALGHCLRMPTMPHHKTGIRYGLISSAGQKLPAKLVPMMLEIEWCPASVVDDLAERAPLPAIPAAPMDLRHSYADPATNESATDLLVSLWGADPSRSAPGKLIKCVAHADTRPSLSILRDDQRVICHAAGSGCILHNDGRGRGTHELRTMAPGRG